MKKGNAAWKPASVMPDPEKKPGMRYRYVSKEPGNMQKKLLEGWKVAENVTLKDPNDSLMDGKQITSAVERRDLVLCEMPEEIAQARDAYFQEQTKNQTVGLKRLAQRELEQEAHKSGARPASVKGRIVIE